MNKKEKEKAKRNRSAHDTSVLFNELKKFNKEKSSDSSSANNSLKFSGLSLEISEFEVFKCNLFTMKQLQALNSTENNMDFEEEDVPNESDKILADLAKFSNTSDVPNNALLKGIMHIIEGQKNTDTKIEKLDKKLSGVSNLAELNKNNIQIINENCLVNNKLILKNLANVNFIKQDKIDDEVFLTGFHVIDDDKYLIKELVKFYEIAQNCIRSYRVVPVKNDDGSVKSTYLFIKFAIKDDQIKFLTAVRTKGSITRAMLSKEKKAGDETKKIKISRSLTPENRKVITRLSGLLEDKKIAGIKYRNCCYQLKPLNEDKFLPIPSIEHLDLLKL